MINVKPQIYEALCRCCPGADVSDEYPEEWRIFPKVTYTEENNAVEQWTDDKEQYARLTYRIDCWDMGSTSEIAAQVDAAMASLGLLRTYARDIKPGPEKAKHKQMRYECIIDVVTEDVFHD